MGIFQFATLNSLLLNVKYALIDKMPKTFTLVMFINSCTACFDIVGGIVIFACCLETKNYSLVGCLLFSFDYACVSWILR